MAYKTDYKKTYFVTRDCSQSSDHPLYLWYYFGFILVAY